MPKFRFIVAVYLVCVPSAVLAQTAAIRGRVSDPQRVVVVDAAVTLTTPNGSSPRNAASGADGIFTIDGVTPGAYVLRVEAAGFDRWSQGVTVSAGDVAVDVTLQIAGFAETVTVAAPKLEEELPQQIERTGSRVQTITSGDIDNGGYDDVGQALQALVPGLFLAPKAGAFDYVSASLQGSRTNEIVWLVDGVRISNRLYNGTTPLDTLPAHMIERIEVVEGGQGLFYGTQAVAGVVNVVTKSFTEDRNGRVQSGFDTNRGGHVNAFARDSKDGHRFVVYGSKDQARGYRSFPESEFTPSTTDRNRSYDVVTFGGKYAYDFGTIARASAMYQRSGVTLDSLTPARTSAVQIGGLAGAFNDRTEQITSGKLDITPARPVKFFVKGYYHQWDSFWNESRNVIGSPGTTRAISEDEFWGFKDYGVNLMTQLTPTRGAELSAGYDFQNYSGQDDVLLIAPNTERVHALFGQLRTTPELTRNTTLALGVRFNAPSHAQSAAVWNASARYDFAPRLFARGGVGTSFRYPDAYELFAIDPTCCFGNPNLKPERSTNVNGSVGGYLRTGATTITLEAIGFYRDVTDLISDVDDGSRETTITANRPDHVTGKGVTFVGSAAFSRAISGSLGYTYTSSQRSNELAGGYNSLAGIPNNQIEASLDVHPRAPFGLTLTVNGVGEMFDTVSSLGSVPSGDYTVVDLAGRVFVDRSRRHRINMRLENLFDEEYTTIHARGFRDTGGAAFLVHNLGTPRTFHLSYSFSY